MVERELLEIPELETKTTELKQILNSGDKALSWLKTVVGFANTLGGSLYIGVNQSDVAKSGLTSKIIDEQVQLFIREVKEHIYPPIVYNFEYLPFLHDDKKLYILKINITKRNEIYYLKFNGFSSVFIREEGRTSLATPSQMNALFANKAMYPYDKEKTDIKFDKNNFTKLYKVYYENNGEALNEKILSSIGFFDQEGFLARGATLFQDNLHLEETLTTCQYWFNISKGGKKYLTSGDLNKNILENIDLILDFINKYNYTLEKKKNRGRETIYSYPQRAVFEGIINAYAHKNYYLNAPIEINIYPDRLEIVSPGSLLNYRELKNEYDIASILPTRRNPLISEILRLIKYMEQKGSGFDLIEEEYSLYDRNHQPFVNADSSFFALTMPNVNFASGVIKSTTTDLKLQTNNGYQLSEKERKILSYCYYEKKTISEIAALLGIKISSYLRNDILGKLVNQHLLEKDISNKADTYLTNRDEVFII